MNENINRMPQVLLLGNGINRSFGGKSWQNLIDVINVRTDVDSKALDRHNVPFPLQAVLVTNNDIKSAMENNKAAFDGALETGEQKSALQKLLSFGFDDILTTNYTYELECAAFDCPTVSDSKLKRISESTVGKVEGQYLIHSYNRVRFGKTENRVWHIHGECRKPNSMILGHYWYANQLARMKKESDSAGDSYYRRQTEGRAPILDSWIDSFILGDVYVLGFGFDFSEIDLWWLLNRKQREKADTGKVYFYEMSGEENYEKTELLRLFGAEPADLGMKVPDKDDPLISEKYKKFYTEAIGDIERRMRMPG